MEKLVGKQTLYTGGLLVNTTLNRKTQQLATQSFNEQHEKLTKKISEHIEGALLSIDTSTGEIKALIGGRDFRKSQI